VLSPAPIGRRGSTRTGGGDDLLNESFELGTVQNSMV